MASKKSDVKFKYVNVIPQEVNSGTFYWKYEDGHNQLYFSPTDDRRDILRLDNIISGESGSMVPTNNIVLVGIYDAPDNTDMVDQNTGETFSWSDSDWENYVKDITESDKYGILSEVLPYIDAMNIDLKVFSEEGYRSLGGDLETVKRFIKTASVSSHVELTTLIVPGLSDNEEDMEKEASWIAGIDPGITLHITRFFPQYRMTDRAPTDIALMRRLQTIASAHLKHVRLGNV